MKRLILNIMDDSIDDDEALYKVAMVVQGGKVSETSKGEQYCFATVFRDGIMVEAHKTKLGHSFRVYLEHYTTKEGE